MFSYKGKTALITGASSGIGAEFAKALAVRQVNLVLVARSQDRLQSLAAELRQQYQVRAEVIAADLGKEGTAQRIMQEVEAKGLTIDLLINNAGFGLHGSFETLAAERDHQQLMVDVAAVVDLTHTFILSLLKRGQDTAIINIASTAGFQPVPYMAVYGASKAFVISFSLALSEEYRQRGLRVITLCPGATDTAFFSITGEAAAVGQKRTPTQVVVTGLRALEHNQSFAVDGRMNDLLAPLSRLLPRQFAARLAGQSVNPRRGERRVDKIIASNS